MRLGIKPVRARPKASIRLVCIPFAGAGTNIFFHWPAFLPAHIEVLGVQLPGRAERIAETPFHDIEPLLSWLAGELEHLTHTDSRPIALFGHSMGAILAFELARRLDDLPKPRLLRLFVSGMCAPQLYERYKIVTSTMTDTEFVAHVASFSATPPQLLASREAVELLLPTLRADFDVCGSYCYRPGRRLRIPISALAGSADVEFPLETMPGWVDQSAVPCSCDVIRGDHFFVLHHQRELCDTIVKHIDGRTVWV